MSIKYYVVAENLQYPSTQEGADDATAQREALEEAGFTNVLAMEVARGTLRHHYGISFGPYNSRAEAARFRGLASEQYGFQLGIVEVNLD